MTTEGQVLHGHYVERRSLSGTTVSRDIAHHLYARQIPGLVVIVTSRPEVFKASIRKQWAAVVKQVELQMASTLNPVRKQELVIALTHMKTLRFSVIPLQDEGRTSVNLMSADQCLQAPPTCHTIYITEPLADERLEAITAAMPLYSLVVIYDQE